MSPSEFQRAYHEHATGGEQYEPFRPDPQPFRPDPQPYRPDPQPYQGGLVAGPPPGPGPRRRQTGRRGVLIGAAAALLLIAVAAVAFVLTKGKPGNGGATMNAGNAGNVTSVSPSVTPSSASPSASPSSTGPTQPPGAAAMATMASYLQQSASVRPAVSNAINAVQACTESPSSGEATLENAITTRQNILAGLQTLSVGALPNGAQLVSALKTAMQNSLNADNDYHAWMADLASSGSACGSNPNQDSNYQAALTADGASTNSKNAFVKLWNPMAPTYGQQTYDSNGF